MIRMHRTVSSPRNGPRPLFACGTAVLAALMLMTPHSAAAQATPLDSGFGHNGALSHDFGSIEDEADVVTVDSQGRILVAGSTRGWGAADRDVVVARYTPSGQIDPSFGFYGVDSISFDVVPGGADQAIDIVVDGQGRIVVLARAAPATWAGSPTHFDSVIGLARLLPNGGLDTSFGSGGKVLDELSPSYRGVEPTALALSGSKIVVGGWARVSSSDDDWVVARYLDTGSRDTSFYGSGYRQIWYDEGPSIIVDWLRDLAVAPNGDLVLAGNVIGGALPNLYPHLAVARLDASGNFVTGFGQAGTFHWRQGPIAFEDVSLELDAEGAPVISFQTPGEFVPPNGSDTLAVVARITEQGALDSSFANVGYGLFRFEPGYSSRPTDLDVLADGRVVVVGSSFDYSTGNPVRSWMGALRLLADGSLDPSFASPTPGRWAEPFWFGQVWVEAWLRDAYLASNGRVYAVGEVESLTNGVDLALVAFAP